ncbi:GGDEF domain-containing protein [Vibrio alfacsensis]|uniref:GGDEF domain-containing protein n=1 Tax=Vibrio alfacsensis TaxID=1074311 RepID=UPI002ADDB5FC|nr:GGDEF domain-containing protein [Vibrio alfacsensis]WQE78452.1 GGDEF domain-containing protein [Vibrio alfacsensis]
MTPNLSRTFARHLLPVMKLATLMVIVVGSSYTLYNAALLTKLSKSIVTDFNQVYSISRRFAQYYNNTGTTFLTKGTHVRNDVSIMVWEDTNAKILSEGVNKLRNQLETIAPDHIWTVAIFENPSTYGHFDPLREEYSKRYSIYKANEIMTRILELERLENTFDQFYGCNIKLSEPYVEDGSNALLRTLYYPVYNHRELDALLVIDIKNSFVDDKVTEFNDDFLTAIDTETHWFSLRVPVQIACTDAEPVYIGFGAWEIFERILIPSILMALFIQFLRTAFKRYQKLLHQDRMTGFYRRDFYEKRLKRLNTFSLLLIDIDSFKSINDTYGHKKGDDVITEVTKRISSQIRASDVAIRWGGEEFLLVMRNMDESKLKEKAETIRRHIANDPIAGLDVTISIGGVHLQRSNFTKAFKLADKALYESKQNGRNQSTILPAQR